MAYEATLSLVITKDGNPFASFPAKYSNLPYEDVVRLEKFGVQMLAELTKWGEESAKAKK